MFIDKELFTYVNYNDPKGRWLDEQIAKSKMLDAARLAYPEVKFTVQEQEKIASFIDLDRYVEEMEAKFIIGEIPIGQWDSYLDNLKKMGADEMSKIRQAAYDRWNSVK
jgi:putative aldouronate transport system substrate-binding protein